MFTETIHQVPWVITDQKHISVQDPLLNDANYQGPKPLFCQPMKESLLDGYSVWKKVPRRSNQNRSQPHVCSLVAPRKNSLMYHRLPMLSLPIQPTENEKQHRCPSMFWVCFKLVTTYNWSSNTYPLIVSQKKISNSWFMSGQKLLRKMRQQQHQQQDEGNYKKSSKLVI